MTTAVAAPPQTPPPKSPLSFSSPNALFTGPRLHPITVKQYQRMLETGILAEENVELIEGFMVEKMSRNPLHDGTHDVIEAILRSLVTAGWLLRSQKAIEAHDSQPEPDFAIVRGNPHSFRTRHPLATEVGLVIEVADSSLRFDRAEKLRIYSSSNIFEYWIVNLVDNRVEVYTQPTGPTAVTAYANVQSFVAGESIPLVLDGVTIANIAVADLLP